MLVDERTYELVPAAAQLLGGVASEHGSPKRELLASMVETTTGVCASPDEAVAQMRAERARLSELAARHGLAVLAAGTHPFSAPEDQPVTDEPYFLDFVRFGGPVARRQAVCGLHVHIGMPDGDTALRALELVLPWLPVVLAVSANSPFFRGKETGLLSTRAEVLATLPRSGAPPELRSFAEWDALVARWLRAGAIPRFTNAWWDARINPDLGTLELRIPDQPTSLERAEQLVTVLHELAVRAGSNELPLATPRPDYQTNRFAASRFGPRAEMIWADELVPVRELAGEAGLDAVCEADAQLAHRENLRSLCADLIARSY